MLNHLFSLLRLSRTGILALTLFCIGLHFPQVSQAKTHNAAKVKEMLLLKKIGYTDAQLIQYIDQAKLRGKFGLQPTQVLQLMKAGMSMQVIKAMGIAKAKPAVKKPVSFKELQGWLKAKRSTAWIKQQLQKRGLVKSEFSTLSILALHRQGLPLPLLKLIHRLRRQTTKPTPRPTPHPRPVFPPVERRNPPIKRQPPIRIEPLPPKKKGLSEREKRIAKRLAVRATLPKNRLYQHIGNDYRFKVPKGWNVLKDIHSDGDSLVVYFTPESTRQITKLTKGIFIVVDPILREKRLASSQTIRQIIQHAAQKFLTSEPGFRQEGKLSNTQFGVHKAVQLHLKGSSRFNLRNVQIKWIFFRTKDNVFQIGTFAPPKSFTAFAKKTQTFYKGFQLGSLKPPRPGKRLKQKPSVQQIIKNNQKGIVSIYVKFKKGGGYGTGFLISSDGYIITNHHVIHNGKTREFAKSITINWAKNTGLPSRKAKLIWAARQEALPSFVKSRMQDPITGKLRSPYQKQHVDIALLKIIKPGVYPTVSMSSIHHASLGDKVVALGFPTSGIAGILGSEDITATIGYISRLITMPDKKVNEILHTAKIVGGNSGGPLFNIYTGAVVGINTWMPAFDPTGKIFRTTGGSGVGYYFALPVDLVWQYFPDYVLYARKKLSHLDWFALGVKWFANRQIEPARRAFARAIHKRPTFLPAYKRLAVLYMYKASRSKHRDLRLKHLKTARQWADKGNQRDSEHVGLMYILARIAIQSKDWQTAKYLLNRAISFKKHELSLYILRGMMRKRLKQFPQAFADAKQAIKWAGKHLPHGHIFHGELLYAQKRFFEGQQAYRKALRIDPMSLEAKLGEAYGYLLLKQPQEAIRKLKWLARVHKDNPQVLLGLLICHTGAKQYLRAYRIYSRLQRLYDLLDRRSDPYSLHVGGVLLEKLKARSKKPKVLDRLKWGVWSKLLWEHPEKKAAGTAAFNLATILMKKRYFGLVYIMMKHIQNSELSAKGKKVSKNLLVKLGKRGLSQNEMLFMFSYPYPSPVMLGYRFFKATPTVITLKTARSLLKSKVPKSLVLRMYKLSLQRKKQGIKPIFAQAGQHKMNRPSAPAPSHQKAAIYKTVRLVQSALRRGDIELWMALRHPRAARYKYRRTFWQIRTRLQNRRLMIQPLKRITYHYHTIHGQKMLFAYCQLRLYTSRTHYRTGYWLLTKSKGVWKLWMLFEKR